MAKQRDPNIDFGFHATIPRVVRTEYKNLTPVQKWLYVCLKDLCGEHGTCYRALRVLAEETGISTGMLSESIRALHDAGLVHAEKKRRSLNPTAKEVWHITIIDIWQANAKTHPTKRSQNEHYKEENVHTVNNNVHTMNDTPSERSPGEQKRSHSETEEVSLSSINYEAVSSEAGVIGVNANASRAALAADIEQLVNEDKTPSGKIRAIRPDVEVPDIDETVKKKATDPSKQTIPAVVVNAAQRTIDPPQASMAGARNNGAVQASVIPKRPLRRQIEKPQLTFGGQQVREWYEQARECKVRMTDKNVITLNRLADIDEMTQENLKDVLELYDTDKWLIDHNVTVDLQELEKQDGKFTFERGLLAVKRKRRAKGPAQNISKNGTDLNVYGIQALLDRQQKAM